MLVELRAPVVLEPSRVVTSAGLVRDALARDVSVLDVSGATRSPCVLPRVAVGTWDADAVASCISGARAVDATLLRSTDEMRLPLADLAVLHDDPTRRDWFVSRLKEALAAIDRVGCVLLPPMLGIDPATHAHVERALGVPVGESLSDPGGPRALRFLRWRDHALAALDVEVVDGHATHVDRSKLTLVLEDGGERVLDHDRVVLALGGVAAGGIVFGTREHVAAGAFPDAAIAPLRPSIDFADADVALHVEGRALEAAGSLFGTDADHLVLGDAPAILAVGFRCDDEGRVVDRRGRAVEWLFAGGDAVEGLPRTALMAVARGAHAGRNAAT
jgi:hypothetical protein